MRTVQALVFLFVSVSVAVAACGGSAASTPAQPAGPPFVPTSFTVKVSGAGRPVIFIPGLACDGTIWDGTVAHLGGKVQAHVLSLAGFAGNPPIAKPLMPTVREELVEYIRRNHLDHPIVVGHSLGGSMTFWVAETAPDLVGGVVAVDGAPYLGALQDPAATPETVRDDAQAFTGRIASLDPDDFSSEISHFIGQMVGKREDAAGVSVAAGKSDARTTAAAMLFLFTNDLRPDLGKIQAPALVVVADGNGERPRDALEKSWHAQVDPIPRHELVIVEHSKHFIMLDQPQALYAALDKFLAAK